LSKTRASFLAKNVPRDEKSKESAHPDEIERLIAPD
jgi:hypothetical protein